MDDVFSAFITIIAALGMFFLIVVIMPFPVMWLMNWLFTPQAIHSVFGVWSFDFWHALGLSTLTGLLFKSTSTTSKS
jgi:hypothetical protein